jgi:hypothetical protein
MDEGTPAGPALFRNFARLDPTPDSIADFARRYGNLYRWAAAGTPFAEWEYEIRTMAFLIELWDAATAKRTKVMKKCFTAVEKHFILPNSETLIPYVSYRFEMSMHPYDNRISVLDLHAKFGPRLIDAARGCVRQAINARLGAMGNQVQLQWRGGPARLVIEPPDLISALWIQFAESIADEREYRQCEVCGTYIELSPDVNRADRRYCSDACRSRALRLRKKGVLAGEEILVQAGKDMRALRGKMASLASRIKDDLVKKAEPAAKKKPPKKVR